jgi:alpha-tubulin suppressor-like RCC1 family protein
VWSKKYKEIESLCAKNRNNIQYIDIGSTHTIIVNSKGKVYTFGWNNFGQCGISSDGNKLIIFMIKIFKKLLLKEKK